MPDEAQATFDALALEMGGVADVVVGRVWHNPGLTVGGKTFAMLVRGRLVVKVPAAHATELVAAGRAVPFEPSPGRRMKEWICSAAVDADAWRPLMREAYAYVRRLQEAGER